MDLFLNSKRASMAVSVFVLSFMAGCTVGPRYHSPAPPAVASYTPEPQPQVTVSTAGLGGSSQRFDTSADIPAQWWTLFRCPELDSLVREALDNSPTLSQATARLKQAQEELRARTGATKYPSVTGNAAVQGEQVNLAVYGIPFPSPSAFSLLNGSVGVSYVLDLFGGNRRLIEGLRAEAAYQGWQLQAARLMLAGNVVSASIRHAQLHSEIEITRALLQLQERELEITDRRYSAGGVSDYDVRSQRTMVAQSRAALPPLEEQLAMVDDQLAVLVGKTPAEARLASITLDRLQLPQELPLTLPSSLVQQRPDIRAAESLLHQASANVGVATANLYPQIILTGSGGAVGSAFNNGGDVWNIVASLAQPIYNGGALKAEERKAQAAYEEAGSVYRQTVLQAFQQVADSLYAIQLDAQTLQSRTEAATQAQGAYQIASKRYNAGGISEVSLLDAQRQQLQTALDRTVTAASRYSDSATLLQALGGGWWNEPQTHATGAQAPSTKP
jgi:NodT family efflux transporter outer membrane factor (OMF) lipoprotein